MELIVSKPNYTLITDLGYGSSVVNCDRTYNWQMTNYNCDKKGQPTIDTNPNRQLHPVNDSQSKILSFLLKVKPGSFYNFSRPK